MLIRWTLKNVARDAGSLVAAAGGIALSLLLVFLLDGMFAGEAERIVTYLRRADADVWVMQRGVANMHMASSLIRADLEAEIRRIPGVAATTPLLYVSAFLDVGDDTAFAYVVGVPSDARTGLPWAMVEGRAQPDAGEAVIPDVLARQTSLHLGDTVGLLGRRLTVSGLSAETYSMANSIVVVSMKDLADLLSAPRGVSYVMVKGDGSAAPAVLADRIAAGVPDVSVVTRGALIENDRAMALQMGANLIHVMTVVGGLVATLLIAFAVHAAVARRTRELGVAKALGVPDSGLYLTVMLHVGLLVALGLGTALALALAIRPMLTVLAPQIALAYLPSHVLAVALWTPLVALLAALPPLRAVARVDPCLVFRE